MTVSDLAAMVHTSYPTAGVDWGKLIQALNARGGNPDEPWASGVCRGVIRLLVGLRQELRALGCAGLVGCCQIEWADEARALRLSWLLDSGAIVSLTTAAEGNGTVSQRYGTSIVSQWLEW